MIAGVLRSVTRYSYLKANGRGKVMLVLLDNGVMLSTSVFLASAYHQCYCARSSLGSVLDFWVVVCAIF